MLKINRQNCRNNYDFDYEGILDDGEKSESFN